MDEDISSSAGGPPMRLKEKYDDRFIIEASVEDREALLKFIRGSIAAREEGSGPDTMVDEEDLAELYRLISTQKGSTDPLILPKQAFL